MGELSVADNKIVYDKLNGIFRDYFEREDIALTAATTAKEVKGWDSLAHVCLVVEIEKTFGIELGVKQSSRLANIGELVDAIVKKTG
jgi:acyl carrier protein